MSLRVQRDERIRRLTESVKHTSQFDSNVTSTDNDSLLGKILEVEESIRVES